jgi:large subunit ribosomal protein L21
MYAIIQDSGRQYRVEEGQVLDLDYRDASTGDEVTFDRVLAVRGEEGIQLGRPTVESAAVTGEVVGVNQGPKIVVQKFRRRKGYRRRTGHRQLFTQIRINKIRFGPDTGDDSPPDQPDSE